MKKLKIAIYANSIVVVLSLFGMFSREPIQGIVIRVWLHYAFIALTCLGAISLFVLLIISCVLLFKRKGESRFICLLSCILYPFFCAFLSIIVLGIIIIHLGNTERVVIENGKKYIYEKYEFRLGDGSYDTSKYNYINWFVRGEEDLSNFQID